MKRCTLVLLVGLLFLLPALVRADGPNNGGERFYKPLKEEVALRTAPDSAADIVAYAEAHWILGASSDDNDGAEWHEIYQIDSGDGFWYVYRMYDHGDNVFVHTDDVQQVDDPRQ